MMIVSSQRFIDWDIVEQKMDGRRSPRGERGLKSTSNGSITDEGMSLPSRGAWIEISSASRTSPDTFCRSPRGERGLKFKPLVHLVFCVPVAPLAGSVD